MGSSASINYCVPVTQKPEGQSAIYRNPNTKDKLYDCPAPELNTMKAVILSSCKKFASRACLGKIVKKDDKPMIQTMTYRQVLEKAHQVGSGIINEKLYSVPQGEKMKLLGIFSKNRVQWGLTDYACLLYNITTIPLYDTLGDQNITYVFDHTQLETVCVNDGSLRSLMKCKDLVKVKNIICFDTFNEQQENFFKERGATLVPFSKVVQSGKAKLVDFNNQEFKTFPDDCLTFSYTSGTTGPPKGAMISHKNFTSFLAAEMHDANTKMCQDDVALSYLPLPHILQRQFDYVICHKGGTVIYFSGDVQKLKDDLAVVKPTIFLSVPRLFSRFYDVLKQKFAELQGFTKTALEYALRTKLQNLEKSGSWSHRVYDRIFFAKTKEALGGRCRLMISGSAPLLPEVQKFLKVVLCAPLLEGYGQTESTGAILFSASNDPVVRHVGGPVANFELKLVDIPEMNYLSTDKDEKGRSTPRGEIWARGPGVFLGYYHNKEKTVEALTEDGWLKTGDVGSMSAQTRAVSIIDRKKNIFKLQQGEYVAAEKVENLYLKGPLLAQVFIHGDSTETFVIGIAVPHPKPFQEFAASKGIEGDLPELCKNDKVRAEIVGYLNKIGKEAGLQGFEQAKNVYLDPEPFLTKGIMTNTMKIQRHEAKKVYRPVIDQLYKEGMLKLEKK